MTDDTRSPEEIERDIERERAGLTDTLDDLQNKFSVESMARQVSDQFREHGGDVGRSISNAVKSNPIALALTGIGLAWLMIGDRSTDREDDDRYGRFNRADRQDRNVSRTRLPNPAATRSTQSQDQMTHSRSSGPSGSYYSGDRSRHVDVPTWAKNSDSDESRGYEEDGSHRASHPTAGSASDDLSSTAGGAGKSLADRARDAAGSVSDTAHSAMSGAQDFASSTSDRAAALRKRLSDGTESLSEDARDRVVAARHRAIDARDATMDYTRQGRDKAVDLFEDQPLIAGALALAVGSAIAAALPRTRTEDQYLGEYSDNLMDEAERVFAEEKDKLSKVAEAATDEAKNVAQEAKGKADSAASADTAEQAVIDKAKSSGKRIADAAKSEADKQNVGDLKKSQT